jgi:hypothetical protein
MQNIKAEFWEKCINKGTITEAIRNHSEEARSFFGPLPAMRADPVELAKILNAQKIMATEMKDLESEFREIEHSLCETIMESKKETRDRFRKIVSGFAATAKALAKETLNSAGAVIQKK